MRSPCQRNEILFWVPNLIGYLRLLLLLVAFFVFGESDLYMLLILSLVSGGLDCVDGYLARRLNQTSAFGAFFDVVIDNIHRSLLWSLIHPTATLLASWEWLVLVCTHSIGKNWKCAINDAPPIVKKVMKNNFRSPLGFLAVTCGIWGLPHIILIRRVEEDFKSQSQYFNGQDSIKMNSNPNYSLDVVQSASEFLKIKFWMEYSMIFNIVLMISVSGRILAALPEIYYVSKHCQNLLKQ